MIWHVLVGRVVKMVVFHAGLIIPVPDTLRISPFMHALVNVDDQYVIMCNLWLESLFFC